MKIKLLFLFLMLGFIIGCNDDPADNCDTEGLTYNNDIASIIDNNCTTSGCHNSGTTTNFPMSNYTEINAAVGFGRIVGAINHTATFSEMPKDGAKLDQCDIDKITMWIADGAPE